MFAWIRRTPQVRIIRPRPKVVRKTALRRGERQSQVVYANLYSRTWFASRLVGDFSPLWEKSPFLNTLNRASEYSTSLYSEGKAETIIVMPPYEGWTVVL